MAIISPLYSGSSGNATYIGYGDSGILIDVGVSAKKLKCALEAAEIKIDSVKAIFITHEHIDHIKGLRVFCKSTHIPVFCSEQTKLAIINHAAIESEQDITAFASEVEISGFKVKRFNTSHDCVGSSGYIVTTPDGKTIGVCTDLGYVSDDIRKSLIGCDLAMIESNHDITMLKNGPYPHELKVRILSDKGHLSNSACAEFITELAKSGTTKFILSHISKDNNSPQAAADSVILNMSLCGYELNVDYTLDVASPSSNKITVV